MKALAIAVLFWLGWLGAAPALAATYTFRSDSYAWESSSTSIVWDRLCTQYRNDDDQATITFSGGFIFPFGGVNYSSVRVLANGMLQFGADTGFMRNFNNSALPAGNATARTGCLAGATMRTIMAYWADLNPSSSGSGGVTWEQKGNAPNRFVVISWNGVFQYGTSTAYTFQVILFENGEFKFQYGSANASGSNATIGVQLSAADYTLYSFNSGYNANGSAIRWFVGSSTPTRVAEFRFDEASYNGTVGEVRDSSGNGLHGLSVGRANTVSTGYVCRGLAIPANTTSASVAVDTFVNPAGALGNSGGFSFWYRSNVAWNGGTAAMIADARSASSGAFFVMRQPTGALRFVLPDGTGTLLSAQTAGFTTAANTWVHVAVSWQLASGSNQSVARIFINGVLSNSTTGTTNGSLDPRLGSLYFGDNRINNTTQTATLNSANATLDMLRLYNYEIGVSEIAIDMAASNPCPPPIDHYELALSTTSLACLPTTVTVTACANNSSPCTSPATSISGATATLATSGATLGASTVTFNASGVATTTLSHTSAANATTVSVTLSDESPVASNPRQCCPDGVACVAANSCSTTFSTSGFVISASAGGAVATLPTQTAGTASAGYVLRAVRSSTTTQACEAAITGVGNVNWSYTCNNPTTCSTGNRVTLTGNAPVAVAGNASGSSASSTAVAMTFDANGNAPFSFNYADVGQITLNASRAAGGSLLTALAGNSNAFVVRPGGFAVSNIRQTAAPQIVNPAAASAAGSKFLKAGEAFTATVTAQTSGGATTPNYGRETAPEGVLLTRALVLPAAGAAGTLSNGSIAGGSFSSGVATVTNLAFSEVGILTLSPAVADSDYLGAGNVTGTTTGHIGRFIPAQFALSSGSVTHRSALSCAPASAFSYLGENFRLGFTLTAQNTAGATTTNYSGAFARLDPTSATWNLAGRDATNVFTVASARLSLGSATGSFSNGVASGITLTANAARAASPDGPFSAIFGVAPVDSDGVAMAAFDTASAAGAGNDRTGVATVPLRFGRLRLGSAAGAADRVLALPVTAQHWNGTAFDTNTLDSCTGVATTAMNFGNLRGTLTTADTAASGAITLASGAGALRLAAPGGGRSGTYDVALSLGGGATDASCLQSWMPGAGDVATVGANLAYLRGNFCASTYGNDPAARATFGRQRGVDNLVYRRENF